MSSNGGKREGAGRKAGAAWASAKPRPVRKLAHANLVGIMAGGRDPLLSLLALADDTSLDPDTRVRAYAAALPFCRPRLSMQVVADVTPDKDDKPSQAQLFERLNGMLERLASSKPTTIEATILEDDQTQPDTA